MITLKIKKKTLHIMGVIPLFCASNKVPKQMTDIYLVAS